MNVFEWYAPHLAGRSAVLDWGCNHGPDSCLLRHRFGDSLDLHACDFIEPNAFPVFRDSARPEYTQLTDPLALPYPAHRFDAVVGSGVLEHTAMDGEALKEVWRVLRYGGLLVVTYLPFAHSWDERRRRARGLDHHQRLYTRAGFARMLLSHGFQPLEIGYQGFVPNALRGPRASWQRALRALIDPIWEPVLRPLCYPPYSHSVLCGIARKVNSI
ncbi:MAG: class I SAM-dependent methyltransferase [Gemmata sp.]